MKIIRKALLPAIVAAGFLGFLGVAGAAGPDVTLEFVADDGDVCSITGPQFIEEGETVDYLAIIQNPEEDATVDVDLNDFDGGDSDITSIDRNGDGNTEIIPETDFLNDEAVQFYGNSCGATGTDLEEALANQIFALLIEGVEDGEVCAPIVGCEASSPPDTGPGEGALGHPGFNDDDIDCGYVAVLGLGDNQCVVSSAMLRVVADTIAAEMFELAEEEETCLSDFSGDADNIALNEDATEFISFQVEDFIEDLGGAGFSDDICIEEGELGEDGAVLVDVTCDDPGVFDLSFAPAGGQAGSIEVVCGSDAETAEIFARPSTVEINPSYANVAHAIVWIEVKGENGEPAFPGTEVQWNTDRCAIESSSVDSAAEFLAANSGAGGVFNNLNPLNPATAVAVETSIYATTAPDAASRQQEETNTYTVAGPPGTDISDRTISAVILHCDPIHAPGVTPGPAVVTAFIERGDDDIDDEDIDEDTSDNDDLVVKTTVTVIGPPAANGVTVTAAPSTLACGEKATITVDVRDSIGQPVSDHTLVEAVTNAGGVLAGTGAVAGQQGLVSPISSTVAETFGGKATIYLLTSTAHVGKYEVVITTGGGGGVTGQLVNGGVSTNLLGGLFTTAPISVQVTVECTVAGAAPAPVTTAPTTGQGITPPSTGDAGLASNDSSWVAGAVASLVAALVVAGFSVKLVREE